MSSIKRYIERIEAEEEMNEWIREHASFDVVEDDPEWQELRMEYLSGGNSNVWDFDDEALNPDASASVHTAFSHFEEQLDILKNEMPNSPSEMNLKMIYSYSVTLMETCLGDMVKFVLVSDSQFIKNAITQVDDFSKSKVTLREVFDTPDIVTRYVLKTFSDYLYHNIDKVVKVYSLVLGMAPPKNVKEEMKEVSRIAVIRHDIVHRNGFDKDGVKRELNTDIVVKAINDIGSFVKEMYNYINDADINLVMSRDF